MDKPHVRGLADWLGKNGVSCFLDEKDLEPGDVLTDALGKGIEASQSALICVGPHGEGPWHKEEVDTLLNRSIKLARSKDEFRIIPVLLPGADTTNLRWFLETRLWVDLRKGITDSTAELQRLRCAILGERGHQIDADLSFNPYRGLEAFQNEDAPFFFGRAKECADLAAKLKDFRFAVIIGPSGNGKSSLVRAGLATEAALAVYPEMARWHRLLVRPGRDLLRSILVQLFGSLPDEARGSAVDEALQRICLSGMKTTPEEWASGLDHELSQFYTAPKEKALIVIDQFEEVFTHRISSVIPDAEWQVQVRLLLDSLAHFQRLPGRRWHMVFALRSDFYQRCRVSGDFWDILERQHLQIDLEELNEDGWREAIKGPAARAGAFLEAGLVEGMLKDVYRQRGSMPLLQLALQELWRLRDGACLTHAAYTTIGGVGKALQRRAETCLENLRKDDAEYYEIARQLFIRLTAPGEGVSDTRRRVQPSELEWEGTEVAKLEHVIAVLSDADNRLIVTDEAVEVTHEVLIRDCGTIRGWIEEVRSEIPMLRRLTHAAQRWHNNERDTNYVSPADPPRELKQWINRATLRLTTDEREFWMESRRTRARQHRDKRNTEKRLKAEREARLAEAENAREKAEVDRSKFKKWFKFTSGIGAAALFLAGLTGFFMFKAKTSENEATNAFSQMFFNAIGSGGETQNHETKALWELAELELKSADVRGRIVERWLEHEDPLLGLLDEAPGYHAAVGIDPDRLRAHDLADRLVAALEDPRVVDEQRLKELAWHLGSLAHSLDENKAGKLAERLVAAIEKQERHERIDYLSNSLYGLSGRVSEAVAAQMAKRLVEALETTSESDPKRLDSRAWAMAALLSRLRNSEVKTWAARTADRIVKAQESSEQPFPLLNEYQPDCGNAMKGLAGFLDPEIANPLAKRMVTAIGNGDVERLSHLIETLIFLASQIDPSEIASLAESLLSIWDTKDGGAGRYGRYSKLPNCLLKFVQRISGDDAKQLVEKIVSKMEDMGDIQMHDLKVLSQSLAVLSEQLPPDIELTCVGRVNKLLGFSGDAKLHIALEGLVEAASGSGSGDLASEIAPPANRPRYIDPVVVEDSLPSSNEAFAENKREGYSNIVPAKMANPYEGAARVPAKRIFGNIELKALSLLPAEINAAEIGIHSELMGAWHKRQMETGESQSLGKLVEYIAMSPKSFDKETSELFSGILIGKIESPESDAFRLGKAVVTARRESWQRTPLAVDRASNEMARAMMLLLGNTRDSFAESSAVRLVNVIKKTSDSDLSRHWVMASSLAVLMARIDPDADVTLSLKECGGRWLEIMEGEDVKDLESEDFYKLSSSLRGLVGRLETRDQSRLSRSAVTTLLSKWQTSESAKRDGILMVSLCEWATELQDAGSRKLAIEYALQQLRDSDIPGTMDEDKIEIEPRERESVSKACLVLDIPELANLLKAPFCRGDLQEFVLSALEEKTKGRFDGDVWKFVEFVQEQKNSGIDLEAPVRRVRPEDVIQAISSRVPGSEAPQ